MRRSIKNAIFILLILLLSLSTALLAYLHFFAPDDADLSGEWTAELDMTQQAAVTALAWLQDIEAVSVSLEDMETYMQDLTVQLDLTLEQTARSGGTFHCHILPESYEACRQASYEALARAFHELLTERLHMAGYAGSTDPNSIEALVSETFGMSTVSYLMAYGPALLPALDELQAEYDGSGVYETAKDILIRRYETGQPEAVKEEHYIRKASTLILTGETAPAPQDLFPDYYPMIYTLE